MTKRVCQNCLEEVKKSRNPDYPYECMNCDEDMFSFETIEVNDGIAK